MEGNPIISKAIANYMDAETLTRLKSGDVTALDELRSKLEEENKTLKEGYKEIMQENQQLKDNLQAQSFRQIVREELQGLGLGGGGHSGSGYRSKVDESIDSLISTRLDKMLGGNDQSQLTADEIRKLIAEEVKKGNESNSSPTQVVDNIVGFITAADEAKKKLGMGGGGGTYLPQMAGGGLRSDVLNILLEDERERLRMNYDHESQMERNKHLGSLAGSVRDNIEDIIGASRDMVKEHRESRDEQPQRSSESEEESEGGYQVKCSLCGEVSTYPEVPSGTFECQHCGGKLRLQQSQERPQPPRSPGETGLEI